MCIGTLQRHCATAPLLRDTICATNAPQSVPPRPNVRICRSTRRYATVRDTLHIARGAARRHETERGGPRQNAAARDRTRRPTTERGGPRQNAAARGAARRHAACHDSSQYGGKECATHTTGAPAAGARLGMTPATRQPPGSGMLDRRRSFAISFGFGPPDLPWQPFWSDSQSKCCILLRSLCPTQPGRL